MTSRKPNSLPPSALSSIPLPLNLNPRKRNAPGVAGTKSTKSPAYMEALKVLSNETIQKACQLALSQRDYKEKPDSSNDNDTTKDSQQSTPSDYEKLLSLYDQCRQAASVIAKEAPPAVKPFLPEKTPGSLLLDRTSSGGALMASKNRTQAKPLVKSSAVATARGGRKLLGLPHRGKGVVPSSTAAAATSSTPSTSTDRRRLLHRENSDSSMGSNTSASSGTGGHHHHAHHSNKRLKLSAPGRRLSKNTPPPTSIKGSISSQAQAPPASVLQFLNKLNKDKNQTTIKKEDSTISSSSEKTGSKRSNTSEDDDQEEEDEIEDLTKPPVEDGDDDNDSDHMEEEEETSKKGQKRPRSKSLSPTPSEERPRRSTRSSPPSNSSKPPRRSTRK